MASTYPLTNSTWDAEMISFSSSILIQTTFQGPKVQNFQSNKSNIRSYASHILVSLSIFGNLILQLIFMSATMDSASAPTSERSTHGRKPADTVQDIVLWRRKNLSIMVLLVATATYVALEAYQLNFITVASWVAMFIVTLLFLWGNIHRLVGKEAPNMSGMEIIREKTITEIGYTVREWVEGGIRWMLRVGAEGEWFAFAKTIASLWLLSFIASQIDLLSFLYTGVIVGMSVPVIYVNYEHKIKEHGRRVKMQSQRCVGMIEENMKKLKSRVVGQEAKEKKTE